MAFRNRLVEMVLIVVFCSQLINSLKVLTPNEIKGIYYHIRGHFGDWNVNSHQSYNLVIAEPDEGACTPLFSDNIAGNVVLIQRGPSVMNNITMDPELQCSFTTKCYFAQQAGAVAVVIGNNEGIHDIMPMYEDKNFVKKTHLAVTIPSMSVSKKTYQILYKQILKGANVTVKWTDEGSIDDLNTTVQGWITAILSTLCLLASVSLAIAGVLSLRIMAGRLKYLWNARKRELRIHMIKTVIFSSDLLNARTQIESGVSQNIGKEIVVTDIECDTNQYEENVKLIASPSKEFKLFGFIGNNEKVNEQPLLHNETCNVCLNDFVEGEEIKLLNCKHAYHEECIETWIIKKGTCPVCKRDVFTTKL